MMTMRKAQKLFTVLIIAAAVLMIWQSYLSNQGAAWGWRGIDAVILCIVSIAVHLAWVRCPHCGKPVPRAAKTHCTYCGKPYDADK